MPRAMRLALPMAAALLSIGHASAQDVRTVPGQLHNAQAIAPFLAKLSESGRAGPPLSIVQIGDSHTAGDMVTNGWRTRWQAEYGAGGRGMTAAGRPYQGYLTWGVTARQSPEWTSNALFGKERVANGPALGLSGFTVSARHAGAWLRLSADSVSFAFDRFSLCGLTGPDEGAVRVAMGTEIQEYSFAAAEPGATCFHLGAAQPVGAVSITTVDDRPVDLTSWTSSRQTGGIMLSNLGVVGARLAHFSRNDDKVLALELRQARPDLLVLAFGTNEGFDPSLKLEDAEAVLRTQVARIRRLLGHPVPILLIGPPDALSSRPEVALPGLADTVSCGGGWYVPAHLAQVRRQQMRLAQDLNLAFWDWQGAMGGQCSSLAWVGQGLQRADHVHFTVDGGRRLGEAIAADLDQASAK
jgi:lysophospholipase L1-like esterase